MFPKAPDQLGGTRVEGGRELPRLTQRGNSLKAGLWVPRPLDGASQQDLGEGAGWERKLEPEYTPGLPKMTREGEIPPSWTGSEREE